MITLERNQVRLLLKRLKTKHVYQTEDAYRELEADHAARGILKSGATIKKAVRIFEEQGSLFTEAAVNDVADVAQNVDAFTLIKSSLTDLFRDFEPILEKAVRKASIGVPSPNNSISTAANKLFGEKRESIFAQLELHRFTFTKPTSGELEQIRGTSHGAATQKIADKPLKNAGGKPLAKHWDAMWAAIAVKLWEGDLQPQTQADIKAAMFDWCNAEGIDVGDTAVTQRARQLWQEMQESKS